MRKKTEAPPAWRAPFLRALKATGNVRIAAVEAGVDRGTCYNHRRRDKRFAERWERALETTRIGAKNGASRGPARTGVFLTGGEDLVLRPSKRCGAQMVKAGKGRWSARAERDFFTALEGTANVRRAAKAAGFSTAALYARKGGHPAFAARWDSIEARAKARLHSLVVEAGIASLDPEAADSDEAALPKVSVAEAIAILRLKGGGGPESGGRGVPEPSVEEVRDEVLRRIAAIRRHRSGGEEGA